MSLPSASTQPIDAGSREIVGPLAASAAQLVESVAQLDDSGANTADRYEWQAAMAAADGLALYLGGVDVDGRLRPECRDRLLCEWHEDWVLFRGNSVVLVSGKHRDQVAGAYTTITKLANDGGLAHLFNRWAALQEKPSCRLVTSGGLSSGPPRELLAAAAHFRSMRSAGQPIAIDSDRASIVAQLRKAIATYCADTKKRWEDSRASGAASEGEHDAEVARFLAALTIAENQVQRDHVSFAAPGMFVQPVLDRLSVNGSAAAVWEAVLSVVRARMRSRGPLPTGELPVVLAGEQQATLQGAPQEECQIPEIPLDTQRALAARTITLTDFDTAITAALAVPGGFEPLPRMLRTSRLEVKMDLGGCSDNAIERALRLRLDYQDYWRDRERAETTARVERLRLERFLHRVSDEATPGVAAQGVRFWRQLQTALEDLAHELPAGMDADLALGGVCDLAGRCKVWFGPRFDVETVIARRRTEPEAQP